MSHHMNPREMTQSALLQHIQGMNRITVEALADCEIVTLSDLAGLQDNLDRRHEIARIIGVSSAQIDKWAKDATQLTAR